MRDPYAVLGVKRDAGADEIKSAWRTVAKASHPDRNQADPSASARFAEAGRAYEMLKDPEKRSRYDQARRMAETGKDGPTIQQQRESARHAAARAKAAQANAQQVMEELLRASAERARAGASSASGGETAEDVIDRIFGAQPQKGQAEPADRTATASQAGDQAPQPGGDKPPAAPLPLQAVDLIASLVRRIRGVPASPDKVPDLVAEATVSLDELIKEAWTSVQFSDGREVKFPLGPGMTDGHVVRLNGQGLKLQGIARGDAVIHLRVTPSERFRVNGYDIHTVLPVSLENAVLGCTTMVESPTGPVEIEVKPWSGSDQTVRVPGLGLSSGKGSRGDLVVELRIILWEKPDDKVTDLMRSMREGLFL
ncbi:DnaJ domain-containing protein [Rhizobiaceae bacterium n13]|uniref:DnaJ domain-containing protein n=1 Tax=Ferirhizobium litorale TaxID=2927786 RepID=A0AAE3U302_9HYPH|nr:DnaJ C-terminal domain-containing protein [Fererhizobium litorale]MDI7861437.1 DnaJ domain-containing protein [Fererhizobium litorale]MDI7921584.1 DnaJ domain-containing protein [Fererhizobium litorale]